ncbi:MAG: hypothetical protein JO246_08190, partial [Frankiaceae bacterium]|nr:hypothetical protein [Frankiaceae bacterium]
MDSTAAESAEVPHEAAAAGKSTPTAVDESPAKAFWNFLVAFGKFLRRNGKRLRVWNQRGGAGASGLATLVETHALQSAGDATITVALAGSLFFSVSTDAAR